jgi:murein DD-endopeptidase MepM/ murein hydrolase activator NlpD/urea transporter
MFVAGAAAVVVAIVVARVLRLAPEATNAGQHSYSALLVGLGAAALISPTAPTVVWLLPALAVLVTVMLTASLGAALSLPTLTLPFLVGYYLLLGALGVVLVGDHAPTVLSGPLGLGLPSWVRFYLRALGALLFLPRLDAGGLVLLALVVHSRVAVFLSALGFGVVWGVASWVAPSTDAALLTGLGLNGMLVAMALGGVWFVPSVRAYFVAVCAVLVCALVELAWVARFGRGEGGLPALIAPFNVTVLLALHAARQRIVNGAPHLVDFAPGTPEQNLTYFRGRTERFGAMGGLRFSAPFRGRWVCTQGVSGGLTHEAAWRHALDFEVYDDEGRAHRDAGGQVTDYYCYRLPVLAPCAGIVARVVDGVKDNAVGELELNSNWGNAVIVYHAPGRYSCVAHLSPSSIAVREGQHVAQGELLGLCGNSGRSATPHLHLQLQATARLGDSTLPIALHDVVVGNGRASRLHAVCVPARAECLRSIEPDPERAAALHFAYERTLRAAVRGPRGARTETIVADVDLLGRHRLRSLETDATLYYEPTPSAFTVHDVIGHGSSVLHLLRVALSRVPFDVDDGLVWTDRLPLREFLPFGLRSLFDVASPFGVPGALEMSYSSHRRGGVLVIEGRSRALLRSGAPLVASTAQLTPQAGLVRAQLRVRTHETVIDLDPSSARASLRAGSSALSGGTAHVQR